MRMKNLLSVAPWYMGLSFGLVFATNAAFANSLEQRLVELGRCYPMLGQQLSQMMSRIDRGQVDQVIQTTMQLFFQVGPDGKVTEKSIERAKSQAVAKRRARFLGQYLAYDLDGDGKISKAEIVGLHGNEAAQIASLRATADKDRDGDISAQELRGAATEQAQQRGGNNSYGVLLAFDLNEDSVVEVDEVIDAIRTFAGKNVSADSLESDVNVTSGAFAELTDDPVQTPLSPTNADGLPVELHMLGIYEPRKGRSSSGLATQRHVSVKVDRPGVSVILALGSHRPTGWVIETTDGTQVDQVIAPDRNRMRGEVILNGEKVAVTHRNLPLAYKSRGNRFQPFHEMAAKTAHVAKAASFQGSYQAPKDGFLIDDAPGVPTRAEIDAALTAAAVRVSDLPQKLQSAYKGKTKAPGSNWTFSKNGFAGRDEKGEATVHTLPPKAPEVSWPMGTAYDPKSQLIWGITLGGEGFLYKYDIAANNWTARSMNNVDAGGLIFDPATEKLIATPGPHGNDGYLILDRSGRVLSALKVSSDGYPGLIDTYDPGNGPSPRMVPVMIEGNLLLVRAETQLRAAQRPHSGLFYLVDLQSGEVRLVR